MEEQHHGAARGGGDPPRNIGRPGLSPPPGFENLVPNQGIEAGEDWLFSAESSPRGSIHGLYPFPPASDSPRSPLESESDSVSSSTRPEVSSEFTDREKMEATNAWLFDFHHPQVVEMMNHKFKDLVGYEETKNRKILHIDWIAGNPEDPVKKKGNESAASGGMSAEDRKLSDSAARSVMRITHGVEEWDENLVWNKAMFFGDWLRDHKGLDQHYLEIQVKRISGADDLLLQQCGISPEYVWLSLHDDKAAAITPIILPPLITTGPPCALPTSHDQTSEMVPQVEQAEHVVPAPVPVSASPVDKGKGPAIPAPLQASTDHAASPVSDTNPNRQPVIVSSDSAQSPKQRTPLPNIANLALRQQATVTAASSVAAASSAAAGPSNPRTGIPRSQNLPTTGSFNSLAAPEVPKQAPTSPDDVPGTDDDNDTEGSIYLAEGVDPFDALIPAHETPATSAADLHRRREEFDRRARAKRDELDRLFAFLADPAFAARKQQSFVYAVRVVAIPDPNGNSVNRFTGPPVRHRFGTILAQGGWVVPPVEERVAWREAHKRAYRNKGAKLGKYEGLPRPTVQHAMPVVFDWSGVQEPRYYGPPPPVWRELCEPCLEDIYWMVWQLVSGRQYLGFNPGVGFGVEQRNVAGDEALLAQCKFKCPSVEAQYHGASYPRGNETKKN